MESLHSEPGAQHRRADQDHLMQAIHQFASRADRTFRESTAAPAPDRPPCQTVRLASALDISGKSRQAAPRHRGARVAAKGWDTPRASRGAEVRQIYRRRGVARPATRTARLPDRIHLYE